MTVESGTTNCLLDYIFHREYQHVNGILRRKHRRFGWDQQLCNSRSVASMESCVKLVMENKAANKGMIEKVCDLKGHPKSTFIIAFSSDGRRMATSHGDHSVRIIDIASGRNFQTLVGHTRSPWTADFHKVYSNVLATGCLAGEVRIWDLTNGKCDTWLCDNMDPISSLALHPSDKILLIAESRNIHIWNWEFSSQPQLFASSAKSFETVKWVKFNYNGEMFYTGKTGRPEQDSFNMLRQAPTGVDVSQLRRQRDTAARARSQYIASSNAPVSLREMLGNPLEISNDLLAQPSQSEDSGMDVYHAATTFAQLHRIHTADGITPVSSASKSNCTEASATSADTVEGAAGHTHSQEQVAQVPDISATQATNRLPVPVDEDLDLDDVIARERQFLSNYTHTRRVSAATPSSVQSLQSLSESTSNRVSSGSSAGTARSISEQLGTRSRPADDSIFGVSLTQRLSNRGAVDMSPTCARRLAVSRPPSSSTRINPVVVNMVEPTTIVDIPAPSESADRLSAQAVGGVGPEADAGGGSVERPQCSLNDVVKVLSKLEGIRGPRRYQSSLEDVLTRLESLPEVTHSHQRYSVEATRHRLLLQQVNCLRSYQRRMSGVSNESRTRLRNLIESISSYCTRQAVAGFDLPSALTPSIPLQGVTVSSQTTYSDSSTNTERPAHRSLGVSTDESLLDSRPRRSRSSSVSLSSVGLWEDDRLSGPVGLPLIRHYSRPRHYHLQTSRHQQVQRWRLDDEVKDLSDESNVIIRRCKIHNDASIDISQDGTILALLVVNPNTASCPGIHSGTLPDTMLRLISLREETLGDVLHQLALVANPVSLSLSPLNSYIIVGLSGSTNNIDHPMIKYDIYKIPPQPGQKLKMCRSVFTTRNDSPMAKVNCVRWLPMSGQGLVIGTNQGHVIINHSVSSNTSTLNDALR